MMKVILHGIPKPRRILNNSVILYKAISEVSQFGLTIKITAVHNFRK